MTCNGLPCQLVPWPPVLWSLVLGSLVLWLLALAPVNATESAAGSGNGLLALSVHGISSQPGDDDPRVLYIMPWQAPTIPRRPRSELNASSPELMQPLDPVVFERHRLFRQSLNPDMDSSLSPQ